MLVGCGSHTDDLRDWVEGVKAKPSGAIEPMPEIKDPESFIYDRMAERSPFANTQPELEDTLTRIADDCDKSVQPDPSRKRGELEKFALESMVMIGYFSNDDATWGLVQRTVGPPTVYKVTEGSYLGLNHGKVVGINASQIKIETLIFDGKGCWEKRVAEMNIGE